MDTALYGNLLTDQLLHLIMDVACCMERSVLVQSDFGQGTQSYLSSKAANTTRVLAP